MNVKGERIAGDVRLAACHVSAQPLGEAQGLSRARSNFKFDLNSSGHRTGDSYQVNALGSKLSSTQKISHAGERVYNGSLPRSVLPIDAHHARAILTARQLDPAVLDVLYVGNLN